MPKLMKFFEICAEVRLPAYGPQAMVVEISKKFHAAILSFIVIYIQWSFREKDPLVKCYQARNSFYKLVTSGFISVPSGIRLFDRLISIVSISFRFANIDANAYASIAAPLVGLRYYSEIYQNF